MPSGKKAGNRRNDMRGIESTAGIDKLATTKAMNSTKIPPEQRNDLRELLCGCVWTQKRQFDCQTAESPLCLFCGGEHEDEKRILWRCPRWETLRLENQAPSNRDRVTWPPRTSRCVSFWRTPESAAWADMGPSACAQSISCNTLPDNVLSDVRFERETQNLDCVVAWTNGACVCNQDARFRRAGCGVIFSVNDDRNCSFTLPGREQTNNRAELFALIAAVKIHDGNLEIRSDSEYVVRLGTSRIRGETQKCNEGNADLWNEFETVLRLNDTRRLEFAWVKGHATKIHIDRQVTTTLNKGGNYAADALASAAAARHSAPQTLTEAAYERQRTAMITHSFASDLLFRRRAALLALHEADHGLLTDCAVVRDTPSTALSVHTHTHHTPPPPQHNAPAHDTSCTTQDTRQRNNTQHTHNIHTACITQHATHIRRDPTCPPSVVWIMEHVNVAPERSVQMRLCGSKS